MPITILGREQELAEEPNLHVAVADLNKDGYTGFSIGNCQGNTISLGNYGRK